MQLNILFVEDDSADFTQIRREIEEYFFDKGIDVKVDGKDDFDKAFEAINDPHIRYDLVGVGITNDSSIVVVGNDLNSMSKSVGMIFNSRDYGKTWKLAWKDCLTKKGSKNFI